MSHRPRPPLLRPPPRSSRSRLRRSPSPRFPFLRKCSSIFFLASIIFLRRSTRAASPRSRYVSPPLFGTLSAHTASVLLQSNLPNWSKKDVHLNLLRNRGDAQVATQISTASRIVHFGQFRIDFGPSDSLSIPAFDQPSRNSPSNE